MTSRRQFLGAVATGGSMLAAGCGCEMWGDMDIAPTRDTRVGHVEGEWIVDGQLVAEFRQADESEGAHDLSVHVLSSDGTDLASTSVPDMEARQAESTDSRCVGDLLYRDFRVTSSGYPHTITVRFDEREALCAEEYNWIEKAVFDSPGRKPDGLDEGHTGTLGEYWDLVRICADDRS